MKSNSILKSLTTATLGVAIVVSGALIESVNAQQIQIFRNPTIEGKKVDACVDSYPQGDGCMASGTREVAASFCESNGLSLAKVEKPYATFWDANGTANNVKKLSYAPGHPV